MRQSLSRVITGTPRHTLAVFARCIIVMLAAVALSVANLHVNLSGPNGPTIGLQAATADAAVTKAKIGNFTIQPDADVPLDSSQTRQVICDASVNGFTDVTFVIPLAQAGIDATTITRRSGKYGASPTPTDNELRGAVKNAKACGLGVYFKPHDEPGVWRAHIGDDWAKNDTAARKWHAAWRAWMVKYGIMADQLGVKGLYLAVEMRGSVLTQQTLKGKIVRYNKHNPDEMIKTIKAVRKAAPKVKLSIAAHTNDESTLLSKKMVAELVKKGGFLSLTYYPRWHTNKPSAAELKKSMQSDFTDYFDPIHKKYGTDIYFAELGTRSIALANAFAKGPDEIRKATSDEDIQAAYFEGLFLGLNKSYIKGGTLFRAFNTPQGDKYNPNPGDDYDDNKSFSWQNKKAETILAKYLGGFVTGYSTDKVRAYSTRVWNPAEGAVLKNRTTVKALLIGKTRPPVANYSMRYRIDGGSWVTMKNSSAGGAHKEASIDPTKWTNGSRHFVIIESRDSHGVLRAKTIRTVTAG